MKALTFSAFGTSDVLEYIDTSSCTKKEIPKCAIGLNLQTYTDEKGIII
jgi:hypothetical protein